MTTLRHRATLWTLAALLLCALLAAVLLAGRTRWAPDETLEDDAAQAIIAEVLRIITEAATIAAEQVRA